MKICALCNALPDDLLWYMSGLHGVRGRTAGDEILSTYREMTTAMNDAETLREALTKCPTRPGNPFVPEVHKEKVNLKGYKGDKRAQQAEIVIPRSQVGGSSNDIGFEKGADGYFKAHISEFDRVFYNEKWLASLKIQYAQIQAKKVARSVGATFLGEKKINGKIVLRFAKA